MAVVFEGGHCAAGEDYCAGGGDDFAEVGGGVEEEVAEGYGCG